MFERYLFISLERYGTEWLSRPAVIALFALALFGLLRPLWQDVKAQGGVAGMLSNFGTLRLRPSQLFPAALIALLAFMLFEARDWSRAARIVPQVVGSLALAFAALSLANAAFRRSAAPGAPGLAERARAGVAARIHMDVASDTAHLPRRAVILRAGLFFGWFVAFMGSMAVIGLIPTVPVFVIAYMRLENREPWRLVLAHAAGLTLFIYFVFHRLLNVPWPETLLGTWFPALKFIPSL
jgi:hypothetical protein